MKGEILSAHLKCPEKKSVDVKLASVFEKWSGPSSSYSTENINYRVIFERTENSNFIDCLIEVKYGELDQWYARALAVSADKAFSRALGSLKALVAELNVLKSSMDPVAEDLLYAA